jgi:uncharacterized integral membrane protein
MRTKVITLMIIIVLFTIFVTQNTEVITVKAFFWQFEMSLIVLMTLACLLGAIAGFILLKIFTASEKRKDKNEIPGDSNLS